MRRIEAREKLTKQKETRTTQRQSLPQPQEMGLGPKVEERLQETVGLCSAQDASYCIDTTMPAECAAVGQLVISAERGCLSSISASEHLGEKEL